LVEYGLSGVNGSEVGPDTLEEWYADRIVNEGRWRTFARILGDSGHSCSSALHAEALQEDVSGQSGVWRYFFDFVDPASGLPGAVHGSEVHWVFDSHVPASPAQAMMENAMAHWWASLAAYGDPNVAASSSVRWSEYSLAQPGTLILDTQPRMNITADTIRPECAHWKELLGWGSNRVEPYV
jgi:carboxylesterase type B